MSVLNLIADILTGIAFIAVFGIALVLFIVLFNKVKNLIKDNGFS